MKLTQEEKRAIKGAIRRAFRQSPRMRDVLKAARVELPPALKKDGSPGARNQVRFKCAKCNGLYSQKHVAVDHKDPVVPLGTKEDDMDPNSLVYGIYCDPSNLQVLCSTPIKLLTKGARSCHSIKSAEENFIRAGLSKVKIHSLDAQVNQLRSEYVQYLTNKATELLEKEIRKQKKLDKKKAKV